MIRQEEYGKEVDIWAMGVVCCVLLTAELPFHGPGLQDVYRKVVVAEVDFGGKAWEGISESAINFVGKLLTVQPGSRPSARMALRHPWLTQERRHQQRQEPKETAAAVEDLH